MQGLAGLKELAHFEPYIAGPELTLADFSATFHFPPVSIATAAIYGEDFLNDLPAAKRHTDLMDERASVKQVHTEQLEGRQQFMNR